MKQIWIACFLRDVGRGYGHVARWTLRVRTKTQKVFHKITLQSWQQKYLINMWLSPSKVGSWLRVSVLSPRATPARRRQHITRFRFRTSAHVLVTRSATQFFSSIVHSCLPSLSCAAVCSAMVLQSFRDLLPYCFSEELCYCSVMLMQCYSDFAELMLWSYGHTDIQSHY